MTRPRALVVRGPYRGVSGYDHTVRELVRHLDRRGVRQQLVDMPAWGPVKLPEALRDPWFDTLAAPVDTSAVLHYCMPPQVVPVANRLTVNYTMFEATRIPRAWAEHSLGHDLVVVPTESSRQAWVAGGVPADRLRLCPLGVDAKRFHPDATPLDLADRQGRSVRGYRTRVLNVSEVHPRKNLLALLRVWIRATRPGDDAILVLKLGRGFPGATLALMRGLDAAERALGRTRREAAPILFLDRVLGDAEMPGLFALGTHYWSMSRGEGWDQPMLEAAATGLRLIAPRHSAYAEYLDDEVATLIPARPGPAAIDGDAALARLFEGADWWEPDEDAAATAIREAIADPTPAPTAARARAAELTWDRSALRLIAVLEELHARRGRRF